MSKTNKKIIDALQKWYQDNHRKLPFRETSDAYSIWISEIMLQQTKVETVLPYYDKFIKEYPDVFSLAQATEEGLLKLLEGIGYYRRFKNLLKAAKVIVSDYQGEFPKRYEDVRALPGIGKYTAGAIMSIAYNKPFAATDGNVIRVLSRVYNVKENMRLEKNKKNIHIINQALIDRATPKIYTQAIMELGALICLPRNPLCNHCPIQENCIAYIKESQNLLPFISKLPDKPTKDYICLILHQGNSIFIRKRTEKLLEGMFEYPQYLVNSYSEVEKLLAKKGVRISVISKGQKYKHIFTHQKWNINVYHVLLESEPLDEWVGVAIDHLELYPMAKAHRQIKII